jgi:CheY-like chemotaxis protein
MSARILLVEDEALVRLVVRDLLAAQGYIVDEAEDGEEGVRKYLDGAGKYDLLLVDYHLPALTGPEVVAKIRASFPACKAILLSGSADQRVFDSTDTECLTKPFENSELLDLVRRSLAMP